ncbi:MAG: site-specific DNA-methyltransferase [Thermaerobacterales bacterium]
MPRIPNPDRWPHRHVNRIIQGDALQILQGIPDACIALIVTSPPYWNVVDYGIAGQIGQAGYDEYLDQLLAVWREAARVLIPNGKLAIVTPIMPIPKRVIATQHTRHLKNLSSDIEHSILAAIPDLHRYSLFAWQKQTSIKMFGSYPYPPNLYEDNTLEFINVLVKTGAPPPVSPAVKEASRLTQAEWRNLTMQVWPLYPEDVRRAGGHPCPFPVALPQRLILMYTFGRVAAAGFPGDIVLDMFNGAGATCVAARATGRNWVGIDLHPEYCRAAEQRLAAEEVDPRAVMLEPVKVRGAVRAPD